MYTHVKSSHGIPHIYIQFLFVNTSIKRGWGVGGRGGNHVKYAATRGQKRTRERKFPVNYCLILKFLLSTKNEIRSESFFSILCKQIIGQLNYSAYSYYYILFSMYSYL